MLGTIIVGLIVLAVVAVAVRSLHKTLKNGGNLQCGDCASAGNCHGGCQSGPTPEQRARLDGYAQKKKAS
jgi:hypothetical protein